MKRKYVIVIVILCIALFGGYFIFDSIFPKAGIISGPTQNRANKDKLIKSISLMRDDNSFAVVENQDIGIILQNIDSVIPTRKMSVNDYPTGEEYTKISCVCSDKTYTYYLYEKNGTTYLEVPYEGVYIVE